MKLILYIIEQIIVIITNNICISSITNIKISNLILFNSISNLIYLLINSSNLFPIYLEPNILLIPLILLIYNYNYKYDFIISGFMFLGIIFYLVSIHYNIKDLIKINLIFPKSIIITNIIFIIFEFFKTFFRKFLFLKQKNYFLNIIIFLTIINIFLFKKIFKNIKLEIIIFINIITNILILKYLNLIKINNYNNIFWPLIFKNPTIYKYNFNIKSIIIFLPIIFISLIENISYITILNIKNNKFLTTLDINKSFFSNSISIIISSLFGSIPNTISEKNIIDIKNFEKYKNINIIISIFYIIISFIKNISYIIKYIPNYLVYSIYLYIYTSILLSCINILLKNINFKDIILITISLVVYLININNIYKISLSIIISLLFNIIFILKNNYSYK